jgi:hypothetical protein
MKQISSSHCPTIKLLETVSIRILDEMLPQLPKVRTVYAMNDPDTYDLFRKATLVTIYDNSSSYHMITICLFGFNVQLLRRNT